jgi:2-isopropylmalate synthase
MGLDIYDTTLRDGLQGEGLSLTVDEKLQVARELDAFGVSYIEGGWPGAIPRDTEFFQRARTELTLHNATLVAFGSTRRPGCTADADPQVQALLDAHTSVVTLVAKSDIRHVEKALHTTPAENLAMVRDTVEYLRSQGRRVFVDAEHFFDGYLDSPIHGIDVIAEAADAGAEAVVLCDTNGGNQPDQIAEVIEQVRLVCEVPLGVHCHDDSGCAVANSLLAAAAGVCQIQVTALGCGERCGNADLFGVVGGLQLKRGLHVVSDDQLANMSHVADTIADLTHTPVRSTAAYIGRSAFAHKAGLHASAIRSDPALYQHCDPAVIGNNRRVLVSDMAGRASVQLKAQESGFDLAIDDPAIGGTVARVKELESRGYAFDTADTSFKLLLHEQLNGTEDAPFVVRSWAARIGADVQNAGSEATVDASVDGQLRRGQAQGATPVQALVAAAADALSEFYPQVEHLRLGGVTEHSVELDDETRVVRVLMSLELDGDTLTTVGVDPDPTAASWRALRDALTYALREADRAAPSRGLALVEAN